MCQYIEAHGGIGRREWGLYFVRNDQFCGFRVSRLPSNVTKKSVRFREYLGWGFPPPMGSQSPFEELSQPLRVSALSVCIVVVDKVVGKLFRLGELRC